MKNKRLLLAVSVSLLLLHSCSPKAEKTEEKLAKTVFQTSQPWNPDIDVRADATIVYGTKEVDVRENSELGITNLNFEQRVESWRERGYQTYFMAGMAWGEYQDYFDGRWDGTEHMNEGQVERDGTVILHGPSVPYVVPTATFTEYIKETQIKRAIDAGITSIFMEEPEFWMRGGYGDAFKKAWDQYYGFPWRAQHESPENTYLANKLKYNLYYNILNEVFTYAKEYGKTKGLDVKCYVPTHSLINYSAWQIVSPEASLASLDCVDGYIAQVWTGTSRVPNYYNGVNKERVFENAFLEYGCMQSMTAPTGRKVYFLTDPIEDRPRDWSDFKVNYEATFAAQLLYPMIADYEVMPWPERIYQGLYQMPNSTEKTKIPREFSTQMQIMINSLNDMQTSANKVNGSQGIGVMMANSVMFQRFPEHVGYEDPLFSSFYGQVYPLLKRGVPVDIVHIENTSYENTFKDLKVLVMSYSNMKPLDPEYHTYIANWVQNGGVLIYASKDVDPFQSVMEWWNTGENSYKTASAHLFETLGITQTPKEGKHVAGKGAVYILKDDPKNFVLKAKNDKKFFDIVATAYKDDAKAGSLQTKNNFYLERGEYVIAAVMDESVSTESLELSGVYIDLFSSDLPVLSKKVVLPGEQAYLYDVSKVADKSTPKVLCGASRVYDEVRAVNSYTFTTKSPANTTNVSRVLLPKQPTEVKINKTAQNNIDTSWDETSKTYLVTFENSPEGVSIEFKW